jgi:hypothetical protein
MCALGTVNILKGRVFPWKYPHKEIIGLVSEKFLCRIRNVLKDAALVDSGLPADELMRKIGAVRTAGGIEYWAWDGRHLGAWHEPAQQIKPGVEVGKAAQM